MTSSGYPGAPSRTKQRKGSHASFLPQAGKCCRSSSPLSTYGRQPPDATLRELTPHFVVSEAHLRRACRFLPRRCRRRRRGGRSARGHSPRREPVRQGLARGGGPGRRGRVPGARVGGVLARARHRRRLVRPAPARRQRRAHRQGLRHQLLRQRVCRSGRR
jgi:hypothetical protein